MARSSTNVALIFLAISLFFINLSTEPVSNNFCWTILAPTKWTCTVGLLIASESSISNLASHSFQRPLIIMYIFSEDSPFVPWSWPTYFTRKGAKERLGIERTVTVWSRIDDSTVKLTKSQSSVYIEKLNSLFKNHYFFAVIIAWVISGSIINLIETNICKS
jgi:hypothetical protein